MKSVKGLAGEGEAAADKPPEAILPPHKYPMPLCSPYWGEMPYNLHPDVEVLVKSTANSFNTQPPTPLKLAHAADDPPHTVRWSSRGLQLATISAGTAGSSGMLIVYDRRPDPDTLELPVLSRFKAPSSVILGVDCPTRLYVMDWCRTADKYVAVGGVSYMDETNAFCRVFIVEAQTGRLVWQFGGGADTNLDAEQTVEQHLSFNWDGSCLCFAMGAPKGLPGKVHLFDLNPESFPSQEGQPPLLGKADRTWLLDDHDEVSRVRWGPRGDLQKRLAVAAITSKRTGRLYIMDPDSGVISQIYDMHKAPISQLFWFPSRQWTPTSPVISPERIVSLDSKGQLHVLSSHTLCAAVVFTSEEVSTEMKNANQHLVVTMVDSPIKTFCLAAFGLRILTGHTDGTVRCFAAFSGQELSKYRGHTPMAPVTSCDWTGSDEFLATMSSAPAEKNSVHVWPSSAFETPAFEKKFSPALSEFQRELAVLRTAISPCGLYLACALRGGYVTVTRMSTSSTGLGESAAEQPARKEGRDSEGKLSIASGAHTPRGKTWSYQVDTAASQFLFFIEFLPGGASKEPRLATSVWGKSQVTMLSANGLSSVWKLGEGSAGPQLKCIRGQCFSPSGKVLAVAHGKMKEAELTVLDAATGKHLWRLTEKVGSLERPSESIVSLRYASSGDLLAVGGAGEHIPMGTVEYEAALGEDEDSIDEDPNIFVYALTGPSKDNLRMVSKHAKGMLVRSLAFSPDEKRLACGGDGVTGIVIVDPHTSGRTLMRLSQYPQVCWSCSFSPNGKEIAAGFNNDEVCAVYDLERKSMVDFFPGRGPVHFSADGMAMIYGGKTEKWVHARLLAHIAPISSLTKSVFGFIRCKSAVQKFPLEEVLKYAKHRLFAGKGPKGGGLLHIAMAGLKHKQSAFTVDDVKRIISAHPLSCLTAIGKMTDAEDGLQPSTPLLMAIDRGWQAVYNHMFEELSKFNPSEVSLPPFSHKMLRIQRQGIQITAAHLIAHFPKRIEVASLCMSLLVMDPPGILRGVPKGANEYAFTVSSLAALTDIVSTELVDEDPRDAELGLEPLTHQKAEPSIYEPQQKAAVCRPHILEKDLYSGSEWQLRVMNFPADEVQEAVMASREPALVFHPLFKSAVRWKWDTYGRRLATAETFLMILFLTIYIAWGSLLLGCPPALPLPGNEAEYDKIFLMCPSITTSDDLWKLGLVHLAMTIPMLGLTSIYVFKELQEGISIEYFHDIFNVIDFVGLFLTIGLALADIALRWIAIGTNDVLEATKQQHWAFLYLASVALLLHFIRLNEKYRAFRVFGTYVRALLQIFSDMGGFVFLLFTIVAAFSISFFWLYNAESEAPDRGNAGGMQIDFSFFRALTFGILAQYSFDDLAGFPRFLSLLIILLWFVTQVVMLNSLIALVSESWATITGQRELNCLIERGTLLQNLDSFWRKGKGMPRMLFVAERGDADMLELHRDTQREEEEHKKRVESSISALSSEVSELKKIVETLAPSPGSALSRSKTGGKGGLGPGGPGGPRGSVASFLTADDISIRERTFDIQSNLAPPDERRVTQQGNPTMKVDSTLMSPVPISADRRSPSRGPRRPEDDSPGP